MIETTTHEKVMVRLEIFKVALRQSLGREHKAKNKKTNKKPFT